MFRCAAIGCVTHYQKGTAMKKLLTLLLCACLVRVGEGISQDRPQQNEGANAAKSLEGHWLLVEHEQQAKVDKHVPSLDEIFVAQAGTNRSAN
jgi:hypothetical protein